MVKNSPNETSPNSSRERQCNGNTVKSAHLFHRRRLHAPFQTLLTILHVGRAFQGTVAARANPKKTTSFAVRKHLEQLVYCQNRQPNACEPLYSPPLARNGQAAQTSTAVFAKAAISRVHSQHKQAHTRAFHTKHPQEWRKLLPSRCARSGQPHSPTLRPR